MSTTFNLSADQYTRKALQLCGVVGLGRPVDNEVLQDARDIFSEMLKTLQARGTTLTQKVPLTLALLPGVSTYVLPANLYDIEFPVTVQAVGDVNENYVEQMVYADYRIISDKTVTGPPTRLYVERLATITAYLWSVPDKAYTLNYQGCQLLPDISDGTTTPGLTQRWMGALTWRLSYWLSFPLNIPASRRAELKAMADQEEAIVMGQDAEHADLQLMLPPDPYGSYT
jgi:hypothetical protein